MSGTVIIGTGGAGGAIASYIHAKSENSYPVILIDSDPTHQSINPPLYLLTAEIVDSKSKFDHFLDSIVSQIAPSEFIILSGFMGKKTMVLMKRFQSYCADNSIPLCVSGVTPFRFEGRKKAREADLCISKLREYGVPVYAVSNNDLLSPETSQTPIEEAIQRNYERIFSEMGNYAKSLPASAKRKPTVSIPTKSIVMQDIEQAPLLNFPPKVQLPGKTQTIIFVLSGILGVVLAWVLLV